jgi:myo-inositol 2-dehydrogenase / D-chiro-inositol 1-dehydrogenase
MSHKYPPPHIEAVLECSRRQFLGGALAAAASGPLLGVSMSLAAIPPRKIKLGLVGCGGRGSWIAELFKQHGGYEFHAVADYFQPNADRCGDALGVDKARRFSGLSGYKKVIESGVEAIALETPPCFFVEHAAAAVEAGVQVYMAKPVAVDVPGCLRIESLGKLATQKRQALFVDYQMPTDPANIQVAQRIGNGEMGMITKVATRGVFGGHVDPPKTATVESRLQDNVWDNDIAICGGYICAFDIHAIDAALWIVGQRPVAAMGASRTCRTDPHGDTADVTTVVFEYADGLVHEHSGVGLPNGSEGEISCTLDGQVGHATVNYWHNAHFHRRGAKPFTAEVVDLYAAGAKRNIATFYETVIAGRFENPTVRRAVDGCLTCILGREAAARHGRLTMEDLLKENRRIELDLSGLKA